MSTSQRGPSGEEPKQYLDQLRQMLASASSDRDETWDLTEFPEIQETDCQSRISPEESCDEEEALGVRNEKANLDSLRQWATVEDRDPESTQDATFPSKDEVAYTLIEEYVLVHSLVSVADVENANRVSLDERVQYVYLPSMFSTILPSTAILIRY